MPTIYRRLTTTALLLLVLYAPLGIAWADDSPRPDSRQVVLDRLSKLSHDPAASYIHGIAQPIRFAKISAPIAASVALVNINEGDVVSKDAVLAVLDNRVAAASVKAAQVAANRLANSQLAEAQVRYAESYLRRLKSAEKGAISEVEISEATAQVQRAAASALAAKEELHQAKANLELEQAKLESHNIRSPFAGRVVRLYAAPGELTSTTEPMIEVADTSRLRAELFLPPQWYGQLDHGHEYALRAGAPLNRTVHGRFVYGEPRIDAASSKFRCVFEIDNRETNYPSGFSVRFEETNVKGSEPLAASQ